MLVVGQNPGTNHPRMLSRAGGGQARGRAGRRDQPAARGRAATVQEPAERVGRARARHRARRPLPADPGERRPRAVPGPRPAPAGGRGRGPRHRPGPPRSSRRTPHGFEAYAAHVRGLSWADVDAATGLPRAEIEALAGELIAAKRVIVCWAMGLTQHKNSVPDDPRDRQRAAAAREHRPPGRGRLPGPRALQRPGRPDDGDLREAVGGLPRRARRGVRVRAAAGARLRHGGRDPGHARRPGQGVLRDGRQLRLGDAGHRRHRGRAAFVAASPCRSRRSSTVRTS